MKLCAQTFAAFDCIGEEKAIRLFKEIGFDCLDYSMFQEIFSSFMNQTMDDMLAYYRDLRAMADEIGIPFCQMHAPFTSALSPERLKENLMPHVKRSISVCGILGAKHLVVHRAIRTKGATYENANEERAEVINTYAELIPLARENGVIICMENHYTRGTNGVIQPYYCSNADDINDVVDTLNDKAGERLFAGCLDIGHAVLVNNSAADMVRRLGSNLGCLHVQDNDLVHDSHIMPYLGLTDVEGACRALYEIGYDGVFSFECENTVKAFPLPLLPDILRLLERVGRYLIAIAEGKA